MYQATYISRLSAKYRFKKPNDRHALELMNAAATAVMKELPEISCAYGISDEFRYDAGSWMFYLTLIVYEASYLTDQADYSKGARGKQAESVMGEN